MGLYKEIDYELRELENQQTQVYNDSADVGILVTDANDSRCKHVKQLLEEEFYLGDIKKYRSHEETDLHTSVVVIFHLPWEREDVPGSQKFRCTTWHVEYHHDKRRRKKFLQFISAGSLKTEEQIYGNN